MINERIEKFKQTPGKRDKVKDSYLKVGSDPAMEHKIRQAKKDVRREKVVKAYSCKKAVYENCKMVAPDGELLSNCDLKKAMWYLERELADKICDKPFTIKLRFEPNGRSVEKKLQTIYDDQFYVVDR